MVFTDALQFISFGGSDEYVTATGEYSYYDCFAKTKRLQTPLTISYS